MKKYTPSPGRKKLIFLLIISVFCISIWKGYSLFVRFSFQRALDSFDPEITKFSLSYWQDAHFLNGQKSQEYLTPKQRLIVLQYLESLQFQKAYLRDPMAQIDGGSSFHIIYETPQGKLFIGRFAELRKENGQILYAEYEFDRSLYDQLREIVLNS